MNVLAIDTTSDICSISLAVNNKIIDSNDKIIESSHTKYLAKNIDSLIKKNTFSISNLDYILLSIGPGSYSGLRVGSSFVKGLSYAIKKQIIPINTFESMIVNSNLSGSYYVALYSHKNYVFAQEFLDGEAFSEQVCDKISNLKKIPIYGYALNKIENIQYNEEKPSAIKMIEYFNQNFESLTKKQKDINDISPTYLKKKN